jgi:hypothetical protein
VQGEGGRSSVRQWLMGCGWNGSFIVEEDVERFYDAFTDALFRTATPQSLVNVKVSHPLEFPTGRSLVQTDHHHHGSPVIAES